MDEKLKAAALMMKGQLGMDLWGYRKADESLRRLLRNGEAMIGDVAEVTDLLNRQARDIALHICQLIDAAERHSGGKVHSHDSD